MTKELSRRAFLRTSLVSGAGVAATITHAAPTGLFKPGTYSARAQGIGEVIVTMTFDADKITDVVLDEVLRLAIPRGDSVNLGDTSHDRGGKCARNDSY